MERLTFKTDKKPYFIKGSNGIFFTIENNRKRNIDDWDDLMDNEVIINDTVYCVRGVEKIKGLETYEKGLKIDLFVQYVHEL